MIELQIENFRIIRELSFTDPGKLSVLVGPNESGKSTLVQAIRAAFVGEAYGHRGKDLSRLVTHGESRFSVKLRLGNGITAARTVSTGSTQKAVAEMLGVPIEVLPLLFDSALCGDGGNKHLKAFLGGAGTARFNPLTHFAENAEVLHCVTRAHQAGAHATTKRIIAFCEEQRAASKDPTPPLEPNFPRPLASTIAAAEAAVVNLEAARVEAAQQLAQLNGSATALVACQDYLRSVDQFNAQAKLAAQTDPLGKQRAALTKLSGINSSTLHVIAGTLVETGDTPLATEVSSVASKVALAASNAANTLRQNPPPASMPVMPVLPPYAKPTWDMLAAQGTVTPTLITEMLGGVVKAQADAQVLQQTKLNDLTAAQTSLRELHERNGAWQTYDSQLPRFAALVNEKRAEWARWDRSAKAIAEAEDDFTRKQGASFGKMVSDFGTTLLQGRHLRVDPTDGIFLGPETMEEVSESTRWRIEVAVMAAIAKLLRSPILLIDGADILDKYNRGPLTAFIADVLMPHFEHIILTASVRNELSEEKPLALPGATKWIITKGQIAPCV